MKCTAILAGSRLPTAHSRIILHRGNTQAGFFQRDLPATARPHLRLGSAWQPPKTRFNYSDRRGYADAATTTSATPARRPGKPKAHSSTGPKTPRARTTAGSKSSATPGRTSAVTKADRVKRVAKTGGAKSKKPGPKPKPKKKKKKATPKKKKAIPKKKTVPKRKVLTPQQKRRLEVQQLKKVGFVHREEYDRKPSSILAIVSHDHKGQNKGLSGAQGEGMTTAQQIKALSPSEREVNWNTRTQCMLIPKLTA